MQLWPFRKPAGSEFGFDPATLRSAEVAPGLLLVTLTNRGFLHYTQNLLASLAPLGLREKLLAFCLDRESAGILAEEGVRAIPLPLEVPIPGFQRFRQGAFRDVVLHKLALVGELLALGFDVLFTDSDVVFLRDPIEDLRGRIGRAEVILQNDDRHDSRRTDPRRINLCMGFFLARSTRRTRRLFDVRRLTARDGSDQSYFNREKRRLRRVAVLDRALYPNGAYYLRRPETDPERVKREAYVIHFNYLVGEEKEDAMRQHGLWWGPTRPVPAALQGDAPARARTRSR